MLIDVDTGEDVDTKDICGLHDFGIATECIRLIQNCYTGRLIETEHKELSADERFQCIIAQGINNQTKKFNKIVVVVSL